MTKSLFVGATIAVVMTIALTISGRAEVGDSGIHPVPCPVQSWIHTDSSFEPLSRAKAFFGKYDGGVYRMEIPDDWNGELVLWAHGYVDENGPQGSQLRAGFPGNGGFLREHLIANRFAWAASSYRCNGYVPGIGLIDTIALIDTFRNVNNGRAPTRIYLVGGSMGGHITVLGLQEFPAAFAAGLAMCPSGPGVMDFFTAVGAASEFLSGVSITSPAIDDDDARLTKIFGTPPAYTDRGRQLASIQIEISGGQRPFAAEGLAPRFTANVTAAARIAEKPEWARVTTNADVTYDVDAGLGVTSEVLNARIRRKTADPVARGIHGPYEETIPFDGRIERPLMTLHGTGDLFVPIALERTLRRAVDAAGKKDLLAQRIMRIPGHCGFSQPEQARAFDDLVTWARQGTRPDSDDVLADLTDAGRRFTDPLRPGDPGTRKPR